jgi:hypothetical protein
MLTFEQAILQRDLAFLTWKRELQKLLASERHGLTDLAEQSRLVDAARKTYERAHDRYFDLLALRRAS